MSAVRCEDFEKAFAGFIRGELDPAEKARLEAHRRECRHCQDFSREASELREVLHQTPELEVSPYFTHQLMREVKRMEQGKQKPEWDWFPLPRFAALTTGFAVALVLGIFFLRFNPQMSSTPSMVQSPGTIEDRIQPGIERSAPKSAVNQTSGRFDELFAETETRVDTIEHRLPERAGSSSIAIPTDDDPWRINQVSTSSGEP
ncbi:MAG: zf-HC2 domain-containing protein [bacterium]